MGIFYPNSDVRNVLSALKLVNTSNDSSIKRYILIMKVFVMHSFRIC